MQSSKTTRRAIIAGIAATPVAGLPALAGAAPMSEALKQAIARHKAVYSVYAEFENAPDYSDEATDRTFGLERAALDEIIAIPCASDAEFIAKLRYVFAHEMIIESGDIAGNPFAVVLDTINGYFFGEA